MPSPRDTQSRERARLGRLIEERKQKQRRSWTEISKAGPIPLETLRRARLGASPLTDETCERLDKALGWKPGSTLAVLDGGDPTPLEDVPRYNVERQIVDTPVGRITITSYNPVDAPDDGLTPDERQELEDALTARMRDEVVMFVQAKKWEIEQRKKGDAKDT